MFSSLIDREETINFLFGLKRESADALDCNTISMISTNIDECLLHTSKKYVFVV